jgi:hypothetical protein
MSNLSREFFSPHPDAPDKPPLETIGKYFYIAFQIIIIIIIIIAINVKLFFLAGMAAYPLDKAIDAKREFVDTGR